MKHFCGVVVVALLTIPCGAVPGVGDDKEDAKKALKALEGNWQLTAQEEFGNVTPKAVVARLRVVIEGDKMSWYIGNPASNMDATITIDPSKDPKTIDAKITKSSAIGKTMLGIYKLDKDTLEICWGVPGEDKRPTKFTAKAGVGSGNVYTRYEREKDIKKLTVKLPDGWKEDTAKGEVRSFVKEGKPGLALFVAVSTPKAPANAEALADMAKRDPKLFPNREWVKTTGIGKLTDGFFIVGQAKTGTTENTAIGILRTIDGATVLFLGVPADDAAARKDMLDICKSAKFGE